MQAPSLTLDIDLTRREEQVLELTGDGFSIPEIAMQLGHSERTAKYFSDRLRHKFHVQKRRYLIQVARERERLKKAA
jgi:DNA-binding CsgD family transcriptional regulator